MESGWNLWVWLVGVVSRRWVWLVGGIYGYGYNVWVWLVGVVMRYIDILIIIINFTYSTCIIYNISHKQNPSIPPKSKKVATNIVYTFHTQFKSRSGTLPGIKSNLSISIIYIQLLYLILKLNNLFCLSPYKVIIIIKVYYHHYFSLSLFSYT